MEGTEWKIEKSEYFDEFGELKNTKFFVYTYKRWLGLFYYKSYVKHTDCGWGDCCKVKTTFEEVDDARKFITSNLCTGGPKEENIYTDVETVKCS